MEGGLLNLLIQAKYRFKMSNRKGRLFACACCRRVWHLIQDERWRTVVERMERYSDKQATKADVAELLSTMEYDDSTSTSIVWILSQSVHFVKLNHVHSTALNCQCALADQGKRRNYARMHAEQEKQCELIRDIIAFTPGSVEFDSAWRTPTVRSLGKAAYQQRNLPEGTLDSAHLQVLADALEEANCTEEKLLSHLRGPGPHVRGCWALDLLLGKK